MKNKKICFLIPLSYENTNLTISVLCISLTLNRPKARKKFKTNQYLWKYFYREASNTDIEFV